jgi:hypothetical protein
MTVTGGFPAPGPQDRDPPPGQAHAAPPAAGTGAARPQDPMLTAHKPGIVSLRPLELSDILDGGVKAVRFNPKSMVGLSALVLGAFLIPSAALGVGTTSLAARSLSTVGPEAQVLIGFPALFIQALFTSLATALLSGLLIHVVGQAVLGRKPDLAETWRSTRGRVPWLLALMGLTGLFSLLATTVLIGPGVVMLVTDNIAAGVILLLAGFPLLIAVNLFVTTKISMAGPAIVLEGHNVAAGLRRSFALTKGAAFWRILGISLLAGFVAGVVGSLLSVPFSLIGPGIVAIAGLNTETGQMLLTFISHVSALLGGAITTPFVAAVSCLLYIDRRIRLEALDVVLMREAQSNPAPRV